MSNLNNDSSKEIAPIVNSNKKSLHIWLGAILINLVAYFFSFKKGNSYYEYKFGIEAILYFIQKNLPLLGTTFFITFIPILLSRLNFKRRHYIGYGIPILIIIYGVWYLFTCTGKMCGFASPIIVGFGLIFAVFYTLGIFLRIWNIKNNKVIILIEIIFIFITILSFSYYSNVNKITILKIHSSDTAMQKAITPAEFGKACDSFYHSDKDQIFELRDSCWERAILKNQGVDVCLWSKETNSKRRCLNEEEIYISHVCEGVDPHDIRLQKYDPKYAQVTKCWVDQAKIYPNIDICQSSYNNKKICMNFFRKFYVSAACEDILIHEDTIIKADPEYVQLTQCWSEKAKMYPNIDICKDVSYYSQKNCYDFVKTISK